MEICPSQAPFNLVGNPSGGVWNGFNVINSNNGLYDPINLGTDIITSISAVASAVGNVGPGIGKVGPSFSFNDIPNIGKWILSLLMLMGRLELFTVCLLFTPYFWKRI